MSDETRIELTERLRREGRAAEADRYRNQVRERLRAAGSTRREARDAAWEATRAAFPPLSPASVPEPPGAESADVSSGGDLRVPPEGPDRRTQPEVERPDPDDVSWRLVREMFADIREGTADRVSEALPGILTDWSRQHAIPAEAAADLEGRLVNLVNAVAAPRPVAAKE